MTLTCTDFGLSPGAPLACATRALPKPRAVRLTRCAGAAAGLALAVAIHVACGQVIAVDAIVGGGTPIRLPAAWVSLETDNLVPFPGRGRIFHDDPAAVAECRRPAACGATIHRITGRG